MKFIQHAQFKKQLRKLPKGVQEKAVERLGLFMQDQFDPLLNNHKLKHNLYEYRSVNVTGDFRIVYRMIDADTCFLFRIGDHHALFGL
jgi:addiction module RelE/StbE family toxin